MNPLAQKPLYITTSIPYVNAEPHVGFALELVQADVLARNARQTGRRVRFQTGTDENAFKNVLAAEQKNIPTRDFVNANAAKFHDLVRALNISSDDFLRTTEPRHATGVYAFWNALQPKDVRQHDYVGLYCPGCEDFYLERDLVDGLCPDHKKPPIPITERNYFFNLSRYQTWLENQIENNHPQITPDSRRREVQAFVRRNLLDFSISRLATRTKSWGTPVPNDPSQTVYVWVDALINYLSALGYGQNDCWQKWWNEGVEKIHVIGKNVWKFHAVYWPALLHSANLPLPDKLLVHGFVTVDGQKIGKSLGNAVDPFALIQTYGPDALRYYLLRAIPPFADGDFSLSRLHTLYNADLANGLGNLVSRLATLCHKFKIQSPTPSHPADPPPEYTAALERFEFDKALATLWQIVTTLNRAIEQERPWQLPLNSERAPQLLHSWLAQLQTLTTHLAPFLPTTTQSISTHLFSGPITPSSPLFPRLPNPTSGGVP